MYKKTIGLRLVAYMIDYILIMVIGGILNRLFGFGNLTTTGFSFNFNLNYWELMVVSILYYMPFAYFKKGQTIGKMCTGVDIKRPDLNNLDQKSILIRELIKSVLNMISIISFIVVLFRKDRKSIHDLIMDSIVVRKVSSSEYIEEKREV